MTWYRTGTVTVTNGSPNVTLAGGDALQNISPDDGFVGPDGRTYAINTIGGAGAFTLQTNYLGATAAGQPYSIIPVADFVQLRDALEAINSLITQYQDITLKAGVGRFLPGTAASPGIRGIGHEGTGLVWEADESLSVSIAGTVVATFAPGGAATLLFPDGTVGTPGIRFKDDTNTGIYRPAGDNIALVTGGSERLRITSNGMFGMGTTTPAVNLHIQSADPVLRIQQLASNATPYGLELVGGGFVDASFKSLLATGEVRLSAGSAVAWGGHLTFYTDTTEKMRITPAGNLGIGTASPGRKLHIGGGDALVDTSYSYLLVNENYGLGGRSLDGLEVHSAAGDSLNFGHRSGSTFTKRMRMNANGFFGIGAAWSLDAAQPIHISYPDQGNARLRIQNTGTGGNAFDLVAGIPGAAQGAFSLHNVSTGLICWVSDGTYLRSGYDNNSALGSGTYRWTTVYAATGTINTSDQEEKDWRSEASEAELRAGLRSVKELGFFQWKESVAEKGDDARYHYGPRAQRVWAIFADEGLVDPIDEATQEPGKAYFGALCFDKWEAETFAETAEVEKTRSSIHKQSKEVECTREVEVTDDEGNTAKVEETYIEEVWEDVEVEETYTVIEETGEVVVTKEGGQRYGVRIDQLHSLMIAALDAEREKQEVKIQEQEARLAALEALLAV